VVRCAQASVNANPVRRSLVVKAMGLPQVTRLGLICELFGNMLAREVGVVTATPAIVEIDDDAASALNASLVSEGLRIEPGIAVGSSYLRPLLPVLGSLPDEAWLDAPRLFGFDLAVQNPDRRTDNPNCALFENRLLAYDFELSFSFLLQIGNAFEAWEVTKHGIAPRHLMYPRLLKRNPSWQPLLVALQELSERRLDELVMRLPEPWQHDMQPVRAHMLSLLGALAEFERELQESVT
jgi:hypothetical protein